jgi:hypothetical protein
MYYHFAPEGTSTQIIKELSGLNGTSVVVMLILTFIEGGTSIHLPTQTRNLQEHLTGKHICPQV